MSKRACKCKKHECEECPEWIFTLADMVMCMMGLFIILWVMKPPPGNPQAGADDRWIDVVAKIREAFDYLPDPQSKDPVDLHILMKKLEQLEPHKSPGDGGQTKRPRKGAEGTDPEVTAIRPSKESLLGGRIHFAAGDAKLSPEARQTLGKVAELIRGHRNVILVKGHASADDFPEGATAPQQMELSVQRAQAAVDHLITQGVEREILRVQGCSTFEPIAQPAYTAEQRLLNRRVEVEATATLVRDLQDRPTVGLSITSWIDALNPKGRHNSDIRAIPRVSPSSH